MRKVVVLWVFALAIGTITTSAAKAADFTDAENRMAAAWVLEALEQNYQADKGSLAKLNAVLAKRYALTLTDRAFARLQACRTTPKYWTNPLPLVAAEHYAYMRYLAGDSGDKALLGAPQSYHDIKTELAKENKLDWLRTTDQPVSPPSSGTLQWGKTGATDGLRDFDTFKPRNGTVKNGVAQGLIDDAKLAKSSWIFSWAERTLGSGRYAKRAQKDCVVAEPKL